MVQELNDLVAGQVTLIRLGPQTELASAGCDQQCANGIDPLLVLKARPNRGRLSPRRPGPLKGADQRLPVFVDKDQGCAQVMPLFLSWAIDTVSSGRSQRRSAGRSGVVVFDNSTPYAARDTIRHYADIEFQIAAESNVRYD
jgi:hypothetical protein